MGAEVVACGFDPVVQRGPFCEEGLVRDLDGRAAGDRVAVEAQQAVPSEDVEHPLHTSALVEPSTSATSVRRRVGTLAVVVEADEAEEDMLGPRRLPRAQASSSNESARFANVRETPPPARYAPIVIVRSTRASNSSVSVYCMSGSAPWQSTISPTISATTRASTLTPTLAAGPVMAASSSSVDIGVITSVPSRSSSPRPRWCRGRS